MLVTKENSLQIQRAWLLARAYNHAWGDLPYDVIINAKSWADVVDAVLLNHTPGLPYGIDRPTLIENQLASEGSPDFGDDNVFHHVTATGRLRWYILPCGAIRFDICRYGNAEPALLAWVAGNNPVYKTSVQHVWGGFGMRHIDALKVALHAVGAEIEIPLTIFLAAVDHDTEDMRDKLREASKLVESAANNAEDWHTCHLLSSEIDRLMYAQTEALDKKRTELIAKYEAANV